MAECMNMLYCNEIINGESNPVPEGIIQQNNSVVLPGEKEFHLFLSHSSQDEEQVIPILEALEDPPYNLKCCFDRRDFTLGETIMDNINFALSKSVATVLFLTPNFIDSDYCSHEKQTAYSLFMEGQGRIIPVILHPCHLPDELRTIHYIDEATVEDIAKKIYKCLTTDPGDFKRHLPLKSFIAGEERLNGKTIECTATTDNTMAQQRREFLKRGIKVDSNLEDLLQMVYCQPLFRDRWAKQSVTLLPLPYAAIFVYLVILTGILILYLMSTSCSSKLCTISELEHYKFAAIVMTGASPGLVLFCCWPAFAYVAQYKRKCEISSTRSNIHKICELSVPDVKCAFHMEVCLYKEAQFKVIKYDISDCKQYLINHYSESNPAMQSALNQRWWQKVVQSDEYHNYFEQLGSGSLEFVKETRHLVENDKLCFCQFYESGLKTNSLRVDPADEGNTRENSSGNQIEDTFNSSDTTALISSNRNEIV